MQSSRAVSSQLSDQLLDIISSEGMIDRDKLTMDSELESFSIESADFVMILMAIEEKFGVYVSVDDELTNAKTLGDLVNIFHERIEESKTESPVN